MDTDLVVCKILDALNWDGEDIAKKARSNSPEINKEEFIRAIYVGETYYNIASLLGIGAQTLHRMFKANLEPILGLRTGGGDTWKLALLSLSKLKICGNCSSILDHSSFSIHTKAFDGLDRLCKECKSLKNKAHYDLHKDSYHKKYIEEHHEDYIFRNAVRRAQKRNATPKWASRQEMLKIYRSRNKGQHVDHIIPLIHPLVCGLHNEFNLRVISAEENMSKGNKFII